MQKKFLGIFYKKWYMWFHYLPLVIVAQLIFNGIAHLFGFHVVHGVLFNIALFFALFLGISIVDQIIHGILSLFGVKD